jgi:hypothetical protein
VSAPDNILLDGERCRWCDSENVYGFESPAYGPSHFCAHCGVVVAGCAGPSLAPERAGCKAANGLAPGHFGNPGRCPQCDSSASRSLSAQRKGGKP